MPNDPSPAPTDSLRSLLARDHPEPEPYPPTPPLPTPQQFYIDLPLYEEVNFGAQQVAEYRAIQYFGDTFDTFCPYCNRHSIFKRWAMGGDTGLCDDN